MSIFNSHAGGEVAYLIAHGVMQALVCILAGAVAGVELGALHGFQLLCQTVDILVGHGLFQIGDHEMEAADDKAGVAAVELTEAGDDVVDAAVSAAGDEGVLAVFLDYQILLVEEGVLYHLAVNQLLLGAAGLIDGFVCGSLGENGEVIINDADGVGEDESAVGDESLVQTAIEQLIGSLGLMLDKGSLTDV